MRCTRPARVTTAAPRAPRDIVITRACDDAFAAVFRDDDDDDDGGEDTAAEDEDDGTIARAAIIAVGIAAAARCDDIEGQTSALNTKKGNLEGV